MKRSLRAMFRVGGWGPYFGDEGSGFWIGREAVRAALRSVDAQGPTEFAQRIAADLGLKSNPEVIGRLGRPQAWRTGDCGLVSASHRYISRRTCQTDPHGGSFPSAVFKCRSRAT